MGSLYPSPDDEAYHAVVLAVEEGETEEEDGEPRPGAGRYPSCAGDGSYDVARGGRWARPAAAASAGAEDGSYGVAWVGGRAHPAAAAASAGADDGSYDGVVWAGRRESPAVAGTGQQGRNRQRRRHARSAPPWVWRAGKKKVVGAPSWVHRRPRPPLDALSP